MGPQRADTYIICPPKTVGCGPEKHGAINNRKAQKICGAPRKRGAPGTCPKCPPALNPPLNETTWLSRQWRDSKFCKNNWSAIWHLKFKKSNGKRVEESHLSYDWCLHCLHIVSHLRNRCLMLITGFIIEFCVSKFREEHWQQPDTAMISYLEIHAWKWDRGITWNQSRQPMKIYTNERGIFHLRWFTNITL